MLDRALLPSLALVGACAARAPVSPSTPAEAPPAYADPGPAAAEPVSLTEQLAARKAHFEEVAEPTVKELYDRAIEDLRASGVVEGALDEGDTAPDFTLPNAQGGTTSLADLRADGPVVLLWYRGGWCPYCNLTLHAYGERLEELEALGATLVAVSPELPDQSLSTAERNALDFVVLSDVDNGVARDFGVLFEVPEGVWTRYREQLDVGAYYAHGRAELPLAATYVIASDGTIAYAYLDADYRNRADPEDVLGVLRDLAR